MSTAESGIERGLETLQALVAEDGTLVLEFQASLVEFFGGPGPASSSSEESRLATRRHLEWFLLERYSESLQGVPAEALLDEWSRRVEGSTRELASAFLASRAGVFAVTGIRGGEGIWLQDLLGLGEYPVEEPQAAPGLGVGDVVVGRVHPVGESLYRVSPAAACFRNAELLEALAADMKRLRESRRGIARISQRDLELMFFRAPGAGDAPAGAPPTEGLRAFLTEAGIDADEVAHILADVADPGAANAVGDLLDQLAFHTEVDLERARLLLLEARGAAGGDAALDSAATAEGAARVGDALAAFDQGRAAGEDLETLFRELEASLGLEPDDPPAEVDPTPDFPGVVGAMVEEFLWETERESGADRSARYGTLRSLGRYAEGVERLGVFENLGARDLLLYLACWTVEHADLACADDARRLTEAAAAFATWAREHHDLELDARAVDRLERIGPDLGRVAEANLHVESHASDGRSLLGELHLDAAGCRLAPAQGRAVELSVPAAALRLLRTGDLARAARLADGTWRLSRSYPPQAAEILGDPAALAELADAGAARDPEEPDGRAGPDAQPPTVQGT